MTKTDKINDILNTLYWLGHDTFCLKTNIGLIYFDPYQIKHGPQANLILVTHDHFDHCSIEDINKIKGKKTIIVTEATCAKKIHGNIQVLKAGESLNNIIKGINIKAIPAYNIDKQFHPKNMGGLGFIVTIDEISIYHAGDTDFIPEMQNLKVDIALLPISGTYVMTAEQAAEAAKIINPHIVIPMHYGSIIGDEKDLSRFYNALNNIIPTRILEKQNIIY